MGNGIVAWYVASSISFSRSASSIGASGSVAVTTAVLAAGSLLCEGEFASLGVLFP
jgi:hypothetical protein